MSGMSPNGKAALRAIYGKRAPSVKDTEEMETESTTGKPTQWVKKWGCYIGAPRTLKEIPAAIYQAEETDDGVGLKTIKFPSDNLSRLPGLPIDFIINQISDFWMLENIQRTWFGT